MNAASNTEVVELAEVVLFGCADLADCQAVYGSEAVADYQAMYAAETTTKGGFECETGGDCKVYGEVSKTK